VAAHAVVVDDVSKRYRKYDERNQTLKAAVLRGRRARFTEFWALSHVSFSVPAGSTFGIIGANGSGKSTMLKCLARILRPDSGRIDVHGKVSALLELGAGFHPELSGRENVFLNGSILGLSNAELRRRFDDIVDFAGIGEFIDAPVKNYSSGMYVRLGFSVALNVQPDVLLIDEILAVGDEQFQRQCYEKISDLASSGRTIVLVSHSLDSVRNLCDQAIWLDHGNVNASGPGAAVVEKYLRQVHLDRQLEEGDGSRWGSGEAKIVRIELLGHQGLPTRRVTTGERIQFRLGFHAYEPITRPNFGIAVHRIDGLHICGPNTRDVSLEIDKIDGSGTVIVTIPALMLLPGTYELSATIYDYWGLHAYDHRHRSFRFDVEPGTPRERVGGVVSLGATWSVDFS
jgi:ABC-2 type transport system ATP-binding protein